jgi:hypothetical protein
MLTDFEKQYGEMVGNLAEIERRVIRQAVSLFDELDATEHQTGRFEMWTMSADKEFIELMAWCRAYRKALDNASAKRAM